MGDDGLTLNDTMPFGKYKGTELEEILVDDREYIVWLAEETDIALADDVLHKLVETRP